MAGRDEGVDAARVGFEHPPRVRAQRGEVALRGAGDVDLAGQNVAGRARRFADPFGVTAGAAAQQRLHLPQPVARMGEAERRERLVARAGLDVRDAPGVAPEIGARRSGVADFAFIGMGSLSRRIEARSLEIG